eukprot:Clim_evm1s90 gene=Clim_evmTU1s90
MVAEPTFTCQGWIDKNEALWRRATVHPFLSQCQTGEIKDVQFNTWLVQDYLFVQELTRMAGRVLSKAPLDHQDTILSGLVALKAELIWYQEKAAERNLSLDVPRHPTCQKYVEFMHSLQDASYDVEIMAWWAIEYVYNQAWQIPGPMKEPYTEFADRWGNAGFTAYIDLVRVQAESVLKPENYAEADRAMVEVAKLEEQFWEMAFSA